MIHFMIMPTFNNRSVNPLPCISFYEQWNHLHNKILFQIKRVDVLYAK